MIFETIVTPRLLLRKIVPETYNFIYANYEDTKLMSFLGLESTEKFEIEKMKFKKGLSTHNRSFVNFQMIDSVSDMIIGGCGFHTWYIDHARAEIGYAIYDERFKQQGLMSEAIKAVLNYGFGQMKLHRVEAFIGLSNLPSLKLVERAGFVKEGLLREHYNKEGVFQDSYVFSLLKSERKN